MGVDVLGNESERDLKNIHFKLGRRKPLVNDNYFASALNLEEHPMGNAKQKMKNMYYCTLFFLLKKIENSQRIEKYLEMYKDFLSCDDLTNEGTKCYNKMVCCKYKPWRNKYKFWLMCDIALVVIEKERVTFLADQIKKGLSKKQRKRMDELLNRLFSNEEEIEPYFIKSETLICQYRDNCRFFDDKESRFLITANMSAGKSTLINALVGRFVAWTAQEACTGNVCYYYNKPYEDGRIHLSADYLTYSLAHEDITDFDWKMEKVFAVSYKQGVCNKGKRLCFIDTPGVNASIQKEHGEIAKNCVSKGKYDYIVYVLNANKLGTDEEISYLKWISDMVQKEKVIFVLNKLDDFRAADDSIKHSIDEVKEDLTKLGYEAPQIYPVSAYYAFLIKKKIQGFQLSEDEEDEYNFFRKKFNKSEYNLSYYYGEKCKDDSLKGQLKKSGLYYFEKRIYGGL